MLRLSDVQLLFIKSNLFRLNELYFYYIIPGDSSFTVSQVLVMQDHADDQTHLNSSTNRLLRFCICILMPSDDRPPT